MAEPRKDDFSDIAAAAGQDDFSDIAAIAQGEEHGEGHAPRTAGESFMARTVGRLPGALDRALGGLPSTAAGVAGAYSAGDEAGVSRALEEKGGISERLLNVLLGTAELGLTSRFPAQTVQGAGIGALGERATGSEEAGSLLEIGTGVYQGAKTLAKGAVKGGRRLFGGESAERMATKGLGAHTTAQEAGRNLQGPIELPGPVRPGELPQEIPGQAGQAISRTSREASGFYKEAQKTAKKEGIAVQPQDRRVLKTARKVLRDFTKRGHKAPGIVKQIMRLGRGQRPTKVAGGAGKVKVRQVKPQPVDEMIEMQSNLRNEINSLAKDDPGRRPLIELSMSIDDAMEAASEGSNVSESLARGRRTYRNVTIPTRTTAGRLQRAETPEQATRMVTGARTPTRFERITSAAPEAAEPMRSAAFNDMVQGSMKGGKLDMMSLASKLDAAEASGQLKNLADTPARQRTIKAIRKAAAAQSVGKGAPIGGGLVGATGGPLGIGGGYLMGRAIQTGMTSERVSRALFRLASAKRGTPGWKMARDVLKRALKVGGPAARAGLAVAGDEE